MGLSLPKRKQQRKIHASAIHCLSEDISDSIPRLHEGERVLSVLVRYSDLLKKKKGKKNGEKDEIQWQ